MFLTKNYILSDDFFYKIFNYNAHIKKIIVTINKGESLDEYLYCADL